MANATNTPNTPPSAQSRLEWGGETYTVRLVEDNYVYLSGPDTHATRTAIPLGKFLRIRAAGHIVML